MRSVILYAMILLTGCASGRVPFAPGEIPQAPIITAEDLRAGDEVIAQMTSQYRRSNDPRAIARVERIVDRLSEAADDRQPWRIVILDDPAVVNAAATRGNVIFVWSGMLHEVPTDSELAVVLSHEIGHVLAQHVMPTPGEQANSALTGISGLAAEEALSRSSLAGVAGIARALVEQSVKGIIINPNAQRKELEADIIGLHLMAEAGYDPRYAVRFWERSNLSSSSGKLSTFLSDHPSTQARLDAIEAQLPAAERRYARVRAGEREEYRARPRFF